MARKQNNKCPIYNMSITELKKAGSTRKVARDILRNKKI